MKKGKRPSCKDYSDERSIICSCNTYLLAFVCLLLTQTDVNAATYQLPDANRQVIGQIQYVITKKEDTLLDIAREYDLGFNEITDANPGVDPWLPGSGTQIVLPTRYILPDGPRKGIVVNVAEMRLYYYPDIKKGEVKRVITFPIGIGREGWETPVGTYEVVMKMKNPSWTMPTAIYREEIANGNKPERMVPPGPSNPLGKYAMKLNADGLLIHGTNMPFSIGMRVSRGCLRMYPEDIQSLITKVPKGTKVQIVEQPYKLGYEKDTLFLESHLPVGFNEKLEGLNMTPVVSALVRSGIKDIDNDIWNKVINSAREFNGVPVPIYTAESSWQKKLTALSLPYPFPIN